MILRAGAGFAIAAVIALLGRRAGALAASGALAATVLGTVAVAAGWGWGTLLIAYFVASSLVSRLGAPRKEERTWGMVEKGGRRDAAQVLANGGAFAVLVLALALLGGSPPLAAAAAGALAASAADTWATEVGTLVGGMPRSIVTLRRTSPGTSGGVTVTGLAASLAGALFLAAAARALRLSPAIAAITAAGVAGALADSIVGAVLQERRWCAACAVATERRVHTCGAATAHAGGLAWLRNDGVNLIATMVGAAVAAMLATL